MLGSISQFRHPPELCYLTILSSLTTEQLTNHTLTAELPIESFLYGLLLGFWPVKPNNGYNATHPQPW